MARGTGGSEGLCCDSFQRAEGKAALWHSLLRAKLVTECPVENLPWDKNQSEMGYEALGLGERGRESQPKGNTGQGVGKVSKEGSILHLLIHVGKEWAAS